MYETHLRQSMFRNSTFAPFTNKKYMIQKLKKKTEQSIYIY